MTPQELAALELTARNVTQPRAHPSACPDGYFESEGRCYPLGEAGLLGGGWTGGTPEEQARRGRRPPTIPDPAAARAEIRQSERSATHRAAVEGAARAQEKHAPGPGADPAPASTRTTPDRATVAEVLAGPRGMPEPLAEDASRGLRFVREKGGRIRVMTPDEARLAVSGGTAEWMTEAEGIAGIRARAPQGPVEPGAAKTAASASFAGDGRPFSEKLRGMERPAIDLKRPAELIYEKRTPWGTVSESERRPSGLEAAADRQAWIDRRLEEERGRELAEARHAAGVAIAERTEEEARIDPLALAKIQAWARLGPEQLKGEYALNQAMMALGVYRQRQQQIAQLHGLAAAAKTREERELLIDQANRLQKWAEAEANLMSGGHLQQFRPDFLSMIASGGFLGSPPVAPSPEGR